MPLLVERKTPLQVPAKTLLPLEGLSLHRVVPEVRVVAGTKAHLLVAINRREPRKAYLHGDGCAGPTAPGSVSVDDVRVYNRALSVSEIAALYNAEK